MKFYLTMPIFSYILFITFSKKRINKSFKLFNCLLDILSTFPI